jgi:hypothetical protein
MTTSFPTPTRDEIRRQFQAEQRCFRAACLRRLERSLRCSAKACSDRDTAANLADLAIKVQLRRHAHEGVCLVCAQQEVDAR